MTRKTKAPPANDDATVTDRTAEQTEDHRDTLFRDLCAQMAGSMTARAQQPLNEKEMLSIYALLAYTAHTQNVSQQLVQMMVEAEFGVNHVTKIMHRDYDNAVRFLVDLRVDHKRH
jgi:hypothetical protein